MVSAAEFASTLRQARRLGSVTSYLPGAGKLSDPVQSANLQQYEQIIGCAFHTAASWRVCSSSSASVLRVIRQELHSVPLEHTIDSLDVDTQTPYMQQFQCTHFFVQGNVRGGEGGPDTLRHSRPSARGAGQRLQRRPGGF